ncbi:MAG: HAMP domain-containing protein, partial [Pseudorhodoplanes sp.]
MSRAAHSIATKLYAIFALLATATVALAAIAVINAQHHAALTDEFEAAFKGSQNVERINSLIYAVVMDSRGVYMSPDIETAKKYAKGLLDFNERITPIIDEWKNSIRPEDQAYFEEFSGRVQKFQEFRRELARRGTEIGPPAGREWGDNDANRNVRMALNKDLDVLSKLYAQRARTVYAQIDAGIDKAAWLLTGLAILAVALAACGAFVIWRAIARPLADITRVTESVAGGKTDVSVPYRARKDEIGGLARSIAIFQTAMRHNEELNK